MYRATVRLARKAARKLAHNRELSASAARQQAEAYAGHLPARERKTFLDTWQRYYDMKTSKFNSLPPGVMS